MIKNLINTILNDLTWGQFLLSKGQFALTAFIALKQVKMKTGYAIALAILVIIFAGIAGHIFNLYYKEDYHRKYYGNFNFANNEKKKLDNTDGSINDSPNL